MALSVALIYVLTTVWKRVMDNVQPGLEIQTPSDRPLPSTEEAQLPRYDIRALGYSDDTYTIASSKYHLQAGLHATDEFLVYTDQAVNPKK